MRGGNLHACVCKYAPYAMQVTAAAAARTKYLLNAKARGCVVGGMVKNKKNRVCLVL